jgi:predicted CoA-substrate-specific enzyme activase
MKIVLGVDVGTRTTKAILYDPGSREVLGRGLVDTGHDLEGAARRAEEQARRDAGISRPADYVAATGYGRYQVRSRDIAITEITCHGVAAKALVPACGSVLDVGAMNSRAIRVGPGGRVLAFRMNDKCASGAGRFLERVARALEVPLEEIGPRSLQSPAAQPISSICAVLAESEVINHVTEGRPIEDILRGAHEAIAQRVAALLRQVGLVPEVVLTGGVTLNCGLVAAIEARLGVRPIVAPDASYAGAFGAALLGAVRLQKRLAA